MATQNKLWTDVSTWTPTVGANTTSANDTTDFSGETAVKFTTSGRGKSNTNFIEISGTWESLFGIASGSVVSTIGTPDDFDWRCVTFTTGAASTAGPLELRDSSGTLLLTLAAGASYSGTTTRATKAGTAQAVPAAQQASNSSIRLRLGSTMATGSSNSAVNALVLGHVNVTISFVTQQAGTATPAGVSSTEAVGAASGRGRGSAFPAGQHSGELVGTATASGASPNTGTRGTASPSGDHAGEKAGSGTASGRAWERVVGVGRAMARGVAWSWGRATMKVTGLFRGDVVGAVAASGRGTSGGDGGGNTSDESGRIVAASLCNPIATPPMASHHHTRGH